MCLKVNNLTIKNIETGFTFIENLSFVLNQNDKIAVIGSEGSGKTSLLNVLYGNKLNYIEYDGLIDIKGKIGFLEQNIALKNNDITINEYFFKNDFNNFNDVIILLNEYSLNYHEIENRKISTFSGGEKIKIGLTKVLSMNPDIIFLDEPSNDLDFESIIFIENFIKKTNIPILFISHDQRLLENVSTGIIHLKHIHKNNKTLTFFENINYSIYKEKYLNKISSDRMLAFKQRAEYKKKIEKFNKIYQRVEYEQNQAVRNPTVGKLLKKKMKQLKSQEKRIEKEKNNYKDIPEDDISINIFFNEYKIKSTKLNIDLNSFTLKNNNKINNIKLYINENKKIVIFGKNGIGKTSLLKYIYNELLKCNYKIGYLPQNYYEILNKEEVLVNFLIDKQKKFDITNTKKILGNLGIKRNEMDYKIEKLSEGTKLKSILFLLISNDCDILLLDEPTRNISPINSDKVSELFYSFKGTIICISHDRKFIEGVFDEIYYLTEDGLQNFN